MADAPDLITDAETSRGLGCTRPGRGRRPMQPDMRRRRISRRESIERQLVLEGIDQRIPWDVHIRTLGDEYKINNSLVTLYARLLVHRHPELAEVIELRQRKEAA